MGIQLQMQKCMPASGPKTTASRRTAIIRLIALASLKSRYILRLWANKKPFVSMFANWEQNELATLKHPPDEYTFRLEHGVGAGGRIVDGAGKPIAGAKVRVDIDDSPIPANGDSRVR